MLLGVVDAVRLHQTASTDYISCLVRLQTQSAVNGINFSSFFSSLCALNNVCVATDASNSRGEINKVNGMA